METLACGHVAHADPSRVCPHLVDPTDTDIDYVRCLTGRGLDADLICSACDKAPPVTLVEVCEGCVARYTDEALGELVGWRGEPGIAERPEALDATVVATPLPAELDRPADFAAAGRSAWLFLTESGRLVRFDPGTGAAEHVATTDVPAEPDHKPWADHELRRRLHVSPDGRFAAVVNDFGREGQVLDLADGRVTFTLDGGRYHSDTVPFSLTFVSHRGRTLVIHRTAWNRLDVSDPATGELLTAREAAEASPGERPEHYQGLFHGALWPSPSGRWLADDGWVWAPVGMPTTWDVHRWLETDRWESEDGPTRRRLCQRWYHWNVPMCWIGDDLLAVSGIGSDDLAMLPGVRIFDVTTGAELHTFPGPSGALFDAGRRLYAATPDALEIWDPFTGHRTGRIPGFVPTHHHAAAGELAALSDGRLHRWKISPPPAAGQIRGNS